MSHIRISAVKYLNTKPFIYGIEHSGYLQNYSLDLDIPAVLCDKLVQGKADIGLVPVVVMGELQNYRIISDYCIGCDGTVGSVLLLSDVPIQQVERIYLDYQSRTSVALTKVLAANFWQIQPEWLQASEGYERKIGDTTAGLVIGDRSFNLQANYAHVYDLGKEWKEHTGLPFVFATWLANASLSSEHEQAFSKAVEWGIEHIDEVISDLVKTNKYPIDVAGYLRSDINYILDERKRESMELFLQSASNIKEVIINNC